MSCKLKWAKSTICLPCRHIPLVRWWQWLNWLQVKNNRDQIDCYKNVDTKLIVASKYKDQNSVFTYKKC